jgi:Na+/H+-dicarboxylate symporter
MADMAQMQAQVAALQRTVAELKGSIGNEPLTPVGQQKEELDNNTEDLKLPDSILFRFIAPFTLVGVILGYLIGMGLKDKNAEEGKPPNKAKRDILFFLTLPGKMFTNFLFAVVGPLIFSIMLTTPAKLAGVGSGVGLGALCWYAGTTIFTGCEMLIWMNILKGALPALMDNAQGTGTGDTGTYLWAEHITGIISSIIPKNLVGALANMGLLGVIGFSLIWGSFLKNVRGGIQVLRLVDTAANSLLVCVINLMATQPFAVCSLLINVGAAKSFTGSDLAKLMGKYIGFGWMMMLFHIIFIIPTFFFIFSKGQNPIKYMAQLLPAAVVAMGTASSAATLPTTISCAIKAGVPPPLAKSVCSVGATVNMDGALIWFMWNSLVVTQTINAPMKAGEQIVAVFIGMLLSCGAAPVPAAGFGSFMVLLLAIGVEITDVVMGLLSVLLGGFWALDRMCTMLNIMGDGVGVGVLAYRRGLMGKTPLDMGEGDAGTVAL